MTVYIVEIDIWNRNAGYTGTVRAVSFLVQNWEQENRPHVPIGGGNFENDT